MRIWRRAFDSHSGRTGHSRTLPACSLVSDRLTQSGEDRLHDVVRDNYPLDRGEILNGHARLIPTTDSRQRLITDGKGTAERIRIRVTVYGRVATLLHMR